MHIIGNLEEKKNKSEKEKNKFITYLSIIIKKIGINMDKIVKKIENIVIYCNSFYKKVDEY